MKWIKFEGKLVKSFKFKDFDNAIEFINNVALVSKQLNHHPKIINIYNVVDIELWTHDSNSITDLDYKLAKQIDSIDQK